MQRSVALAVGMVVCMSASVAVAQDPPADAPEEPPKTWSWNVGLGFSLRTGQQDSVGVNFEGNVEKRWEKDTLGFRLIADYGQQDGVDNTNNASGQLPWRHNFTERFFWVSTAFAGTDQIQNRDVRFIADTGPGYRIWMENEKEFLDLGTAFGYRYDQFKPPTMPLSENFFDLRFFYRYNNKLGDYLEVIHGTDFSLPVNDPDKWFITTEVTLLAPIYAGLAFRTNYRLEYNAQPAINTDPTNPDFRVAGLNNWLTMGLQYEY